MIPEDRRPELKEYSTVLVTADDQPLKLYGQADFNIKFGSYWVRHTALVAEVTNDGLIPEWCVCVTQGLEVQVGLYPQ